VPNAKSIEDPWLFPRMVELQACWLGREKKGKDRLTSQLQREWRVWRRRTGTEDLRLERINMESTILNLVYGEPKHEQLEWCYDDRGGIKLGPPEGLRLRRRDCASAWKPISTNHTCRGRGPMTRHADGSERINRHKTADV
jgi:hypothetical protein